MYTTDHLLIDGSNLAFRSFYALKPLENTRPVNAIYGFVNTLWSFDSFIQYKHLWIAFDCSRSIQRTTLLPTYKANRAATPEEMKQQLPIIHKLVPYLGGQVLEIEGIEADDLLGSLAQKIAQKGQQAILVSADKDLMQCVNIHVQQLVPSVRGWNLLGEREVYEKMGVWPKQIVDYLTLIGDSADNFNGIPGVGPKTAASWLQQHNSIEQIFEHLTSIQPERFQTILAKNRDLITRNQQLARLATVEYKFEKFDEKMNPNFDALVQIFKDLQLNSLVKRIQNRSHKQNSNQAQAEFDF